MMEVWNGGFGRNSVNYRKIASAFVAQYSSIPTFQGVCMWHKLNPPGSLLIKKRIEFCPQGGIKMSANKTKVTIDALRSKKEAGEKITRVVLWDYPMACIANRIGVDMILVGDSLGMCVLGYANTLPVTMEDMIHHCKAVTRATDRCFVVGDLPFMSYETDTAEAVRNAGRLVKEGGVDAVKIEGGSHIAKTVEAMTKAGIPAHGHIGLTPQKIKQMGGFKTQGKTIDSAVQLFKEAAALTNAGCFAITLECVPPIVGKLITERIPSVITVSAGAGPYCDAQSVNLYDTIGLTQGNIPKFSKQYGTVADMVADSLESYCRETRERVFPAEEHFYTIDDDMTSQIVDAIEGI
jgi:3-methyl-2-oxobutanoate hydroxymethyltransferase